MKRMRNWVVVGLAAVGLMLAAASPAWANNLRVTNVTVVARDATTAFVKFDIAWENSWRYTNINHDAAWVFFKAQPESQTYWTNVIMEYSGVNPTACSTGTGTAVELIVPPDRVGLFVRPAGEGFGPVAVTNVQVVWNFASNGLTTTSKVKIRALAVEVVYVAEGAFKVGSGGTGSGELYAGGGGTNPFQITNAGPITCGNAAGQLWGASQAGDNSMGGAGTISSNFPNGYAAFYCMKYEITQGQYADFLNALTRDQQDTRCVLRTLNYYMSATANGSSTIQYRNTVRLTTDSGSPNPRVYTTVTPDRACNWPSWADGAAFADWSGLRPMTELEFEKACRGPLTPVWNEYAWGSTVITQQTGHVGTDGSGTETASPAGANCLCGAGGIPGPVRVGIYATGSSSRQAAGASYWGIMELSGSLWERSVTIGNGTGRAFTGLHGDGNLNATGGANVTAWPGADGFRGGNWLEATTFARASDRGIAALVHADRAHYVGVRGVRSAPSGVGP